MDSTGGIINNTKKPSLKREVENAPSINPDNISKFSRYKLEPIESTDNALTKLDEFQVITKSDCISSVLARNIKLAKEENNDSSDKLKKAISQYINDKKINGYLITEYELSAIYKAAETIIEVRRLLHNLPSNRSDSSGDAYYRDYVFSEFVLPEVLKKEPIDIYSQEAIEFSIALALEKATGKCSEFAQISCFVHSPKLQEGESLSVHGNNHPVDAHYWAVLKLTNGKEIIIDSWQDLETPIFAEDCVYYTEPRVRIIRSQYSNSDYEKFKMGVESKRELIRNQSSLMKIESLVEEMKISHPRETAAPPVFGGVFGGHYRK
ncbi:hypothetical protein [uncultured Endozoicomonas sp.]|uniref:hypothetical protein n=1 Tax=uncultured Endozoicomonas sp. TaxID=432652 RepID=UPI002611B3D1|nr:hypothetical protein [uncultured Endozoicomonas sp.]